jgi:nucleotide-binding universal stress UspA family protein
MTASTRGEVATKIADMAAENGADLIIVGTRGHSALGGVLLGGVTQRLLHVAPCPVLMVPPPMATARPSPTGQRRWLRATGSR